MAAAGLFQPDRGPVRDEFERGVRREPGRAGRRWLGQGWLRHEPCVPLDGIERHGGSRQLCARKKQFGKKRMDMQQGGSKFRQRDPLTMWEEYAHALLQGNETSFVD